MAGLNYPSSSIELQSPSPPQFLFPASRSAKTLKIKCKSNRNPEAWTEKKKVSVDYDKGEHHVTTHVSGLRKRDIPKRYRLRVEGDRFQKDWSLSDVARKVLALHHLEDVQGVLNHWVGRFSRKNFPLLIKVQWTIKTPLPYFCTIFVSSYRMVFPITRHIIKSRLLI